MFTQSRPSGQHKARCHRRRCQVVQAHGQCLTTSAERPVPSAGRWRSSLAAAPSIRCGLLQCNHVAWPRHATVADTKTPDEAIPEDCEASNHAAAHCGEGDPGMCVGRSLTTLRGNQSTPVGMENRSDCVVRCANTFRRELLPPCGDPKQVVTVCWRNRVMVCWHSRSFSDAPRL